MPGRWRTWPGGWPRRPCPAATAHSRVWPEALRAQVRSLEHLLRSRAQGPTASSSSRRHEFLDRLADLVPPPRKHRHRYHGVFAPNHKLRKAITALAIGNIGKRCEAATGGHAAGGQPTEGCCDALSAKPSLAFALLATSGCCGLPVREPGADPQDSHALGRTTRTAAGVARPRPAHRLRRARASALSTATSFRDG